MIALPPPDRALPALDVVFDGDLVAELLDTHLPDRATGRYVIAACRPHYVRYKPGTSCLVQHELTLHDHETAQTITLPAHIRLYADDRGGRRWRSRSLQRQIERVEVEHAGFPRDRAAYLPAMRALVQVFPVDLDLRKLVRATSPATLRHRLTAALPAHHGQPTLEPSTLVRYKPGRKALLRVPMTDGVRDAVYAKLHDDDRGATLFNTGTALRGAGMATPAPLTYLPDYRMLVHAAAPGEPLAALRQTPVFTTWMEPAAATLSRLHATHLPGLSPHSLPAEAGTLTATAEAIARLLPSLAPRVHGLAAAIAARLTAVSDEQVTSHGDFYDDQLLVGAGEVVLIDLDEVRSAHPLLDVGNMLAHLTIAAGAGEVPAGAGDAFRDAYLCVRPARRDLVTVFEAAALLKLAVGPFRRLELDWPAGVERTVRLAEERLAAARGHQPAPAANGRRSADIDPTLPQLRALLDPARMAGELAREIYGQPVSVPGIEIVRHKPGRRAILRYEVEIDGPGSPRRERLYGKTFASERGLHTFRTTAALALAQACGPEVRLPAPVGYLPRLKLMLLRDVPGEPVATALRGGDTFLAERIAAALHRLHTSRVCLERVHDLARELDPLRERVHVLSTVQPSLAATACQCLDLVERGRARGWSWRRQPIHRDLYHDQILIAGDHLAILDLDDAALSEPAVDVANFAAHLRLLAIQTGDDPGALAAVATAFRQRYRNLDPTLDPALLRFLEGATLLRLAAIHISRANGLRIAGELLRISKRDLGAVVAEPTAAQSLGSTVRLGHHRHVV